MTTVPFRSKPSAVDVVASISSDPDAPISAMIEIADRCNEVCVHCYQVQGQKGEMTTDEVRGVIDQLAEMGVLFLTISGGEPTLRPDFLDIVGHARARGFAVKVFTNGLTMTPDLARNLSDLAVQEVQISLYSHRAEVHDWITRVPGSWERTVRAVQELRKVGVATVVKSPLMSVNASEYPDWVAFAVSLDADYMMDPHLDPREDGNRAPLALRIEDADYIRFVSDPTVSPPIVVERTVQPLDSRVCGACSGDVHVEANGELRPCTQMNVPVGHALLDGIASAVRENESARTIRGLTWSQIHGCRECDLRAYCSHCFANAQVEGGDALGPYASACHGARLMFRVTTGRDPSVLAGPGVDRDPSLGPYRRTELGEFETILDRKTPEDEDLAGRFPWLRPGLAGEMTPGTIRPGDLVQIRRPGKRLRLEQVPQPGTGPREG